MLRYDLDVLKAERLLDKIMRTKDTDRFLYAKAHYFAGGTLFKCDGNIVTDEKTANWKL